MVLAPLIRGQKGEYRDLFDDLLKQGFARARVDGRVVHLSDSLRLDRQMRHNIEVVIDRLVAGPKIRPRLAEAVEMALATGSGQHDGGPGRGRAEEGDAGEKWRVQPKDADAWDSAAPPPTPRTSPHRPPTSSSRPTTPARTASSASSRPARSCSASTARRGCVPSATGWARSTVSIRNCWFPTRAIVPAGMRGAARHVAGHGALAAAHLPRRGRVPGEEAAAASRARCWKPPGKNSIRAVRDALLWGTGDEHITFTWRSGPSGYKWGGKFEGIIPKLLSQYRTTQSQPQRRQLEKYMRILGCQHCDGQRLNPQARAVSLTDLGPRLRRAARADAAGALGAAGQRRGTFRRGAGSRSPRSRPSPPKR